MGWEVSAMFRRVIVPLDGPQLAEQALPYGVAVAERIAASIVLVRAYAGPAHAA